jgi:hypothetical protein
LCHAAFRRTCAKKVRQDAIRSVLAGPDGEFAYVVDLKSVQRLLVRGQQSTSLVHQALAVGGESRIPPILDEQGLVESAFE